MKKGNKSHQFSIILVLFMFTLISCGDGDDGDNDPGVETIRSGQWSGNVEFGEVTFEVTSDSTGLESFEVIFSDFTCGIVTHNETRTLIFNPKYVIVNRNIDIDITFQSSDYINIEGTFEPTGDYISGDFELENEGTVCSGSWDAHPI
ncbi:MAG: hypothetical protein DRI83_09155 [Bacteroidetes bacterium]|nr:MAG: hypothetical protein DRI83_09155 [Bacteroidota bacterium]